MTNRFQTYLLQFCLFLHRWFSWSSTKTLKCFGPITLVYVLGSDNKVRNITLNYHTGIGLFPYRTATYYLHIITSKGSERVGIDGNLSDLPPIITLLKNTACTSITDTRDIKLLRRKKVVLMDHAKPIDFDLRILDNYYPNTLRDYGINIITNLGLITKVLGLSCTHISISQSYITKGTISPIEDIDLSDIYY